MPASCVNNVLNCITSMLYVRTGRYTQALFTENAFNLLKVCTMGKQIFIK